MKRGIIIILILIITATTVLADEWQSMNSNTEQDLRHIFMLNPLDGWAAGGKGIGYSDAEPTILRTTDGGENWTTQTLPSSLIRSDIISSVCFSDLNYGWAVGPNALRTEDSGETWVLQDIPGHTESLEDVWCLDDDTAVAVGSSSEGRIFRTTGGGMWTTQLTEISPKLFSVYFVNSNVGYAGGHEGKVYKTIDSGISWTEKTPIISNEELNTTLGINNIFCLDEESCWVSGGGEVIYYTDNSGEDWESYSTGGAVAGLKGLYFKDSTEAYVVGQSVIRYTTNSALNWSIEHADISYGSGILPINMLHDVTCHDDVCWTVGDEGTILRLNEPRVVRIVTPPPREIPLQNDTEEQPEHCTPFFDDCEAGWYPVPIYDFDDCIVDYICVEEENYNQIDLSEENIDQFSSYLPNIPGIGKNERMNVFIDDDIYGIIIMNTRVNLVPSKEIEKNSLNIYLSEETLDRIAKSEDPSTEAIDAIDKGDIIVKGDSFSGKVKSTILKIYLIFK